MGTVKTITVAPDLSKVLVTVETVRQPDDGDWTSALLAAIEQPFVSIVR